jgi:hypothetical protein
LPALSQLARIRPTLSACSFGAPLDKILSVGDKEHPAIIDAINDNTPKLKREPTFIEFCPFD